MTIFKPHPINCKIYFDNLNLLSLFMSQKRLWNSSESQVGWVPSAGEFVILFREETVGKLQVLKPIILVFNKLVKMVIEAQLLLRHTQTDH